MESIIVACITGVVTLIGAILSNSKSRAVMEVRLDALTEKVEKRNQVRDPVPGLGGQRAEPGAVLGQEVARPHEGQDRSDDGHLEGLLLASARRPVRSR